MQKIIHMQKNYSGLVVSSFFFGWHHANCCIFVCRTPFMYSL